MRLRRLLLPLNPLYRLGLSWRERRLQTGREPVRRLRSPVISIGNLSTGGAGKTPLTIASDALLETCSERRADFLASFSEDDLRANVEAFIDHLKSVRPSTVKGPFITGASISPTMGPGVALAVQA